MGMLRQWNTSARRLNRVNHVAIEVVNKPATEPITIFDAQRHLHIDYTFEDPSIELMLVAARQKIEAWLRRALITQTIELTLDWGPAWVELPRPPLVSVTSIQVVGLDNTEITVDPATYFVRPNARLIGLLPSAVWPTHITPAGWKCTYVAGYGDTPDHVPVAIRLAILNVTAAYYEKRGTLDQLVAEQAGTLQDFRVTDPPFRLARGPEPVEFME